MIGKINLINTQNIMIVVCHMIRNEIINSTDESAYNTYQLYDINEVSAKESYKV
jgi:hypothetical protein